jgi:hypothetical protein
MSYFIYIFVIYIHIYTYILVCICMYGAYHVGMVQVSLRLSMLIDGMAAYIGVLQVYSSL